MPRLALAHAAVAALAAGTLAACATGRGGGPLDALNARPAQEYRGHYTLGPGGAWFRPCGAAPADSALWVTVVDRAAARVEEAKRAGELVEGRPSYVQWRGVTTRGGEVGPRGSTALIVREVLVVRPSAAGDCASP
jgi:hypothetical protein